MSVAIEIVASDGSETVTAIAEPGARVLDLCDDTRAPVPFSCRGASCGVCRVRVESGAELLAPARSDERELLDLLERSPEARGPTIRLACQLRIIGTEGCVRLYALESCDRP
ncbi:MAG: 2Fe-2S iron-sulfur cluster-binding protein [Polyangiaceae bacterium]